MKVTYDTDAILFSILRNISGLNLSGGIYPGARPDNSTSEDIVINTIALSVDSEPQIGTSNINIHVPDMVVGIGGASQYVEDRARLKALADLVTAGIRNSYVLGLTVYLENQTTIAEGAIKQHFVNIRVNWNIHA